MSFKDWLDKQARESPSVAAALPAEPDPFEGLIGRGEGGLGQQSPFDAFLERVEAEKPADFVETKKKSDSHDWQIVQAAVYSQDSVVWVCSKCCRTISVKRDETVSQALAQVNVNPDCSLQVTTDVMDL